MVGTTNIRSYFDPIREIIALSIPSICYQTEDSGLNINEIELIKLYGHEGMGHALNYVLTGENDLPYFLKTITIATKSTKESVAQFYENVIFNDLDLVKMFQLGLKKYVNI